MSLLTINELRELRDVLVNVFAYTQNLQKTTAIARYVKAPQVPSAFSESLAIHLLQQGAILPELQGSTFSLGGVADVVAVKDNQMKKIEVKATGDKGFQRLGPKDLLADYLIWIHFNLFFRGEHNKPLIVWTVEKPGRFFQKTGILSVTEFKTKCGINLKEILISFDELK